MKKRALSLFALAASVAVALCGCNAQSEHTANFFAMNTYMSVTAYGDNNTACETAAKQVQAEVTRLDKLWSVTDKNSELYAINSGKTAAVSDDTAELIRFCLETSELTDGAFDPTIYPVLTAWGFTLGENRVPEQTEITELLKKVGYKKISLDGNTLSVASGTMLDFGAVAKGAAADKAAEIMKENGITSALINLGGSITVIGKNPDNSDWRIGVKNPFGEDYIGVLSLSNASAVTSGAYERNFTAADGTVYGHIIDPSTGRPTDNDLASVTVISQNATLCDALSTALFVMGREKAVQFYNENGTAYGFDIILITKDKELILSGGAAEKFRLTDKSSTISANLS